MAEQVAVTFPFLLTIAYLSLLDFHVTVLFALLPVAVTFTVS